MTQAYMEPLRAPRPQNLGDTSGTCDGCKLTHAAWWLWRARGRKLCLGCYSKHRAALTAFGIEVVG